MFAAIMMLMSEINRHAMARSFCLLDNTSSYRARERPTNDDEGDAVQQQEEIQLLREEVLHHGDTSKPMQAYLAPTSQRASVPVLSDPTLHGCDDCITNERRGGAKT